LGLDPNQKRTAAGIILATLALCALFLAQGATSLFAAHYLPLAPNAAASGSRGATKTANATATSFEDILKRNIFDSAQGALWPPPTPEDEPGGEEEGAEEVVEELDPSQLPPACAGSLRLIATVHSERRPEWSFASIATGSGAPLLYRLGNTVENHELVEVFPRAVYMKPTGGAVCSMCLFVPAQPAGTPMAAAAIASAGAEPEKPAIAPIAGLSSEELAAGIEKVSDSEFNIQRSLVDKVLSNQGELMRAARVVPHEQGGRVVGVKLYGIRRNSLLGEIGMQNGDMLSTVNGFDMSSPDTALEAYAKLRSANDLTVAVQRRGRSVNLQYHIR